MHKQLMKLITLAATVFFIILMAIAPASRQAIAQEVATTTLSAYDAIDSEIKGIDPTTIDAYRKGEGAGLALPAELNGYPGPRHVLDLADKLSLTTMQRAQIQALYNAMKPQAIALGTQLLGKEAALEKGFHDGTLDEQTLQASLSEIGTIQTQLQFVHLRTHLATVKILTPQQVMLYNQLRGYASGTLHAHDQMQMPTAQPTP